MNEANTVEREAESGGESGRKEEELERLREDVARLREDLLRLGEHLGTLGMRQGERVRETASAKVEALRAEIDRLRGQLGARGSEVAGELERKIREQPLLGLLAAFGIGFVLSRLLERR